MDRSEAAELIERHGGLKAASEATGIPRSTLWSRAGGPRPRSDADIEAIVAEAVRKALGQTSPEPDASPPPKPPSLTTVAAKPYSRVIVAGDWHVPYHDPAAVNCVLDFAEAWKPDLFVVNGDFYDFYGPSRWMKRPGRKVEIAYEREVGRPILQRIDRLGCDVVFGIGNHDARLDQLICDNPSLHGAIDFRSVVQIPERWTVLPDQYHYRLGPVTVLHGNLAGRGGGAKHIAAWMFSRLKTTCVFGHFHRAAAYLEPDYDGVQRGGYAVGHLCLPEHADYVRVPDWSCGFASIDLDHDAGLHDVRQHTVVAGRARIGGVTYGG